MKVIIVGGCPSSDYLAPFDTDAQVWVHGNQLDRHEGKRIDKIFEIHDDLSEHDEAYPQWLINQNIDLVVGVKFPLESDRVTRFPFGEVYKLLDGDHLTSTPAYMMALAILSGAESIGIYGVDMAVDDHEYFYQRPTMYAWIAYAKAKGIEITIPDESSLFKDTYIEGRNSGGKPKLSLEPFSQDEFLQMAQTHNKKMDELQAQQQMINAKIQTHDGCRQSYERMAKVARAIESGQQINSLADTAVIR